MTIPGDPVSKSRPRFSKQGYAYTDRKTVNAEKLIREMVAERGIVPVDVPVGIAMTFYCETRRRTDGDNLQKLVMDAMNKVVFTDDYLVEESFWTLHRKAPGEEPRTEVFVYTLEPEPS